jgi:tryptophan synthase alpha chain
MSGRIDRRFEELREQGRAGLVTFTMAGDPDHNKSLEILLSLPDAGADLIEIGMPFTDPVADGPAIQSAGQRALEGGANMHNTLKIVRQFRKSDENTPLILMGYLNPVMAFGYEKFMKDAHEAGVDGLIIVDLPPEEDQEVRELAFQFELDMIRLVTPTTDERRLPAVLDKASGLLYFVSIAGVTGTASVNSESVGEYLENLRQYTDLPVAAGFGIKTPRDVAAIGEFADAVVVGSAIVNTVAEYKDSSELTEKVIQQVRELRSAL